MFCLNNLITKSISYWHTMTHRQVGSFVWRADSSPVISKGLPTLADKIAMAFGTSKLNNCMVTIFVLKKMYLHGKLFTLIRPLHLMTLWLWKEWLYNKWLTRKTHSCVFTWFCPVFNQNKFCPQCLWRFPFWDKICKIKTNDPHLLSIGDDKTICLNKQLFC